MTVKPTYEELEKRVQELEKIESELEYSKEALQENESLFKLLYEKAPLGYQSLDENGHFIVVNQTWLDTLGYTREEVIGKSFADFLHPDWRDHFKQNFPRFKSIGEVLGVEFEMIKKNGDLILVSFTGKINRDKKGNFQQTHCIFHDITDRKRMEKALRESEEKYRILFEHTGEALFVAQDARIVFQNPRSTELLGYSAEEFQSKPFFDFIHEDDREMVTDHHIRRLRGEKLPERYNFRIIHKNGSILWAELNAVLFQWNGRPAVLCFMTDITKRKQIEDGLIESEALFRGMFKGHSAVMLLIDPNTGRIIMANQAAAQYYGYPLEKMLQMKIQQLNVLSPAEITKKMGSAFTKQVNSFEFQHMLADGQVRDVEVHSAPITIQHQTLLFSIVRDITERNQAEATLRESEERIRTIGDNLQGAQLYQLRVAPDGGTMFTYVSSKVQELHECKPEEILKDASLLFKRVHPADVDEWQKRTHKSLRELTTYDHTVRIVRKSGEIRWHRMISKPRKLDDGSVLFDGVELDVTEHKQAQEALQESLTRYDELVANVPVGVYVFWIRATGHLEFEYVSDRWCEIHQVKREYVLSDATRVNNLVHPDDQDDFLVRNQESFLKRIPFAWEGRFLIGDGDFLWLRIESTPIVFDNGDIRWFGLTWDITDRKQAEEALRESNKTAHQFFSESSAGAFFMMLDEPVEWKDSVDKEKILDYVFDHQRITKINRAMLDHYLASEKDFLCMTPKQLFAHDLEHGRLLWRKMFDQGFLDIESDERRFDGSQMWIIGSYRCMYDEQGRIIGHFGTQFDITERKRAEAKLRLQSLVLDQIEDRVTVTDLNGVITYVNDAEVRAFGYSRDELIGFTTDKYGDDPERGATQRQIIEETLEKGAWRGEVVNQTVAGEDVILDCRTSLVLDEQGNKIALAGISTDITDLKKMETQLNQAQKMESVGRLAGGVAHDFNNMLGVILGHTELALLHTDDKHKLCSDLKEIQKAAERSADITKQLLAFARKEIISPKQLDLNDTVESMLNMLRRLIGEDIDLVWQPTAHLWPVKMDPSQIDQILANLCVNARDAIAGVGKLTIETGKKSFDEQYCNEHPGFIPGDFVLLAVSDNGCGMDKDTLKNLFEPFFTTKDVGKGTGLGLATVYGIVKQNNGFINVYSEPGQGSTFKIYLPRFSADEDTDKAVPEKKAAAGGTETILLVEDEPTILRMTRMMLERKGYSVLSAATPTEAVDKAKEHSGSIDLLMTDVVMPEMNGRNLAAKMTEFHPDIKLLFMSGYTADVIAHQGVLDDGVAFIQKPFSMADMTEKVREVLDIAPDKN